MLLFVQIKTVLWCETTFFPLSKPSAVSINSRLVGLRPIRLFLCVLIPLHTVGNGNSSIVMRCRTQTPMADKIFVDSCRREQCRSSSRYGFRVKGMVGGMEKAVASFRPTETQHQELPRLRYLAKWCLDTIAALKFCLCETPTFFVVVVPSVTWF